MVFLTLKKEPNQANLAAKVAILQPWCAPPSPAARADTVRFIKQPTNQSPAPKTSRAGPGGIIVIIWLRKYHS